LSGVLGIIKIVLFNKKDYNLPLQLIYDRILKCVGVRSLFFTASGLIKKAKYLIAFYRCWWKISVSEQALAEYLTI